MKTRRSLTPTRTLVAPTRSSEAQPRSKARPDAGTALARASHPGLVSSRRAGARHGISVKAVLRDANGAVHEGWANNVSRGGMQVTLDQKLERGREFEITLTTGADPPSTCRGRVVWIREADGRVVCGIEVV